MSTLESHRICPTTRLPSLAQSEAFCRRYARSRRENFVVASCLLPRRLRRDFYNIYTYCRAADDLADELDSPQESRRELDLWQHQLELCYDGRPTHVAFVALQATIRRYSIPREPFLNLLTAFRRDQTQNRYATLSDLVDYCRYSANPVGHLILSLGECFDARRAALSDEICTGLQLTNHWQDIASDFRRGRIYLPQDRCEALHVTPEMLSQAEASPELRTLIKEQVEIAEGFFRRGLPLLDRVPGWLRTDLELFIAGGRAALEAIRRADFDVLGRRCSVSRLTQGKLIMRAACRQWFGR